MLYGTCPGGGMSNLYTYYLRLNVDLSGMLLIKPLFKEILKNFMQKMLRFRILEPYLLSDNDKRFGYFISSITKPISKINKFLQTHFLKYYKNRMFTIF